MPYSTFWMVTFQILTNNQYIKLHQMLTVKIGDISLPNPWLSSATTLSNITDTICLTVAAAVVQIVASFMKYNLKHKTMALGEQQNKLVTFKALIKDYMYLSLSCQRLSGQSWTWPFTKSRMRSSWQPPAEIVEFGYLQELSHDAKMFWNVSHFF